jgi:hypothetical protein
LSSHKLVIEQGRYNKTNRNRRTCKLCIHEIEDEMHFILLCPSYYVNLRKQIYQTVLLEKAVYKMLQLLSVTNTKELCNLGKYVFNTTKLRNVWR